MKFIIRVSFKLAGGTQADICIGHKTESEYVKDSCTKADFTINDPDKHDLKIKAMKEDLVGAYECVVSDDEKYPADLMAIQGECFALLRKLVTFQY